jgi:hypothetical protein
MPNYAFDPIHTRPGIKALKLWLEAVPGGSAWTSRQVAPALWFHESGICNQTLDWPVGRQLRLACERGELLRTGVAPQRCEELFEFVRTNYRSLAEFRRKVWQEIYRRAYWEQAEFEIIDSPFSPNESNDS